MLMQRKEMYLVPHMYGANLCRRGLRVWQARAVQPLPTAVSFLLISMSNTYPLHHIGQHCSVIQYYPDLDPPHVGYTDLKAKFEGSQV